MNGMLDAALAYAARGWGVLPVHGIADGRCTCGRRDCSSRGKHPLTRHGLMDATTDEGTIHAWWKKWGRANIAIATGQTSRLVVVDLDLPCALDSLDRVIHKLPRTLTALTGGGGVHLFYAPLLRGEGERPLRNRASALPGMPNLPGIDLRADGGYIVAPPSMHASGNRYQWLDLRELGRSDVVGDPHDDDQDPQRDQGPFDPRDGSVGHVPTIPEVAIAEAPAWLKKDPRRSAPAMPPSPPKFSSGDGTPYGLAALENALSELRTAPVGTRNHTLNRVAFGLAHLVLAGHLSETAARAQLTRVALAIGLGDKETRLTIKQAISDFYAANVEVIERHRVPTLDFESGEPTQRKYPRAKVIDMIFFIEGSPRRSSSG